LKKERIESKTPQTYFLMLEAKKPNSRAITNLLPIKLSKEVEISNFSFNFKQMEMEKIKESLTNQ
jgi:hypothetical protein